MRRAAVLAAGAVLVAAVVATSTGASGPPRVVARDGAGAVVAALPLDRQRGFGLAYRHSYERAPAEERFRARPGGGFELHAGPLA